MNTQGRFDSAPIIGSSTVRAMERATSFLQSHSAEELLHLVGKRLPSLAIKGRVPDKRFFPVSYGGGKPCDDDVLTGLGAFYVTQDGRIMLDCIGGHYQMLWGYNHPELLAATAEGARLGIVWDNHANTPSVPVKRLADELAALAEGTRMDRVFLGVCTGSVACETALKIMLLRYKADPARRRLSKPVILVLEGNYHGTNLVTQTMRGMWPGFVSGMETVSLEPNDSAALEAAFRKYGPRVAGFWAEPVMMNREAIRVDRAYLLRAQQLCRRHDTIIAIDEIQTGFWYPDVFMFRELKLSPDIVVVGKGMTAGFHPLAGLLYRRDLDLFQQYDAICTNGNASFASFMSLCSLRLLKQNRKRLGKLMEHHFAGLTDLASEFPGLIERIHGHGFLSGIKFRDQDDALGCHKAALARGLWIRVHAYHPGHRTLLIKHPLVVDEMTLDFVLQSLRELFSSTPWR